MVKALKAVPHSTADTRSLMCVGVLDDTMLFIFCMLNFTGLMAPGATCQTSISHHTDFKKSWQYASTQSQIHQTSLGDKWIIYQDKAACITLNEQVEGASWAVYQIRVKKQPRPSADTSKMNVLSHKLAAFIPVLSVFFFFFPTENCRNNCSFLHICHSCLGSELNLKYFPLCKSNQVEIAKLVVVLSQLKRYMFSIKPKVSVWQQSSAPLVKEKWLRRVKARRGKKKVVSERNKRVPHNNKENHYRIIF